MGRRPRKGGRAGSLPRRDHHEERTAPPHAVPSAEEGAPPRLGARAGARRQTPSAARVDHFQVESVPLERQAPARQALLAPPSEITPGAALVLGGPLLPEPS